MVVRKRVEGRIEYNDGEFAEVQTVGIEGIEEKILTIHPASSSRFPVDNVKLYTVSEGRCHSFTT